MKIQPWLAFVLGIITFSLVLVGCELGDTDSVTRNVGVDFSGVWTGADGASLVTKNTGKPVKTLNIRQSGDQLEATDNNNKVFRGSLGDVENSGGTAAASFELKGETTEGVAVTLSGTLSGTGTSGTMRGTWIEPSKYINVYGVATISLVQTNSPTPTNGTSGTLSIEPSSATISTNGLSVTFTAKNVSGTATWSVTSGTGGIVPNSNTVSYTRFAAGNNTLRVSDTGGHTASATITQP